MAGVNKVILVGNLGADPEIRYTAGGTAVCRLSIATSRRYTDKQGNRQEETAWHRVDVWGKMAETCGQYLSKGRQVYIEGRLKYGSYEKDGVKHYTTDIVAENMQLLGSPGQGNRAQEPEPGFGPPEGGVPEDDIPF
ncbi:MAG: single-stranded DNA-binding protein [Deltaproteobacteria bacterium]|nr:single-stranded DNA-binding protein [Deltaproteobacteria bacterium]